MTDDQFFKLAHSLVTHSYRFAKTMRWCPHWYTLRRDWDDSEFVETVKAIREHGYDRRFYSRTFRSFAVNESYYWTMDEPIDKDGEPWTVLINKARRDHGGEYDKIAPVYDSLFTDDASLDENVMVCELIGWKSGQSVLDVGCGTGLFLEYNDCKSGYVGVDPSIGMVAAMMRKFDLGENKVVCTEFEKFYLPEKFDKVIATFGSASYIEPSKICRVRRFLKPGGTAVLMFYKDGYTPVTYLKSGVSVSHRTYSDYKDAIGDHATVTLGNYVVAIIG